MLDLHPAGLFTDPEGAGESRALPSSVLLVPAADGGRLAIQPAALPPPCKDNLAPVKLKALEQLSTAGPLRGVSHKSKPFCISLVI